ncbi:MAG: PQQ-binding-like beta-propeller repeat protein [Myxococcota bacterium]
MAVIRCSGCGAPLQVSDGAMTVVCQYCNATTRVAAPAPNVNVHVHVHGNPPVYNQHAPPVVVPPPVVSGAAKVAPLIVTLMILLGVGVSVAVPLLASRGHLESLGGLGAPGELGSSVSPPTWSATGACLVDANGDEVLDAVGLADGPNDADVPTIVDGRTGEALWAGANKGSSSRLFCASERWVVIGKEDFGIQIIDVTQPESSIQLQGRDQLRSVGMGDGCVSLETTDGSVIAARLPEGAPGEPVKPGKTTKTVDCSAQRMRRSHQRDGIIELTGSQTERVVDGKHYLLSKRERGTPMLRFRVTEESKTLVDRELPYVVPTFGSGLAVGSGRAVVLGAALSAKGKGILVGLDASTGEEVFATPLEGLVTHSANSMDFNGRYVVVQYWTELHAYDPATGAKVW